MSGRVFKKDGKGYLAIGYGSMYHTRSRSDAFRHADRMDAPRVEDLARALPGWVEIEQEL